MVKKSEENKDLLSAKAMLDSVEGLSRKDKKLMIASELTTAGWPMSLAIATATVLVRHPPGTWPQKPPEEPQETILLSDSDVAVLHKMFTSGETSTCPSEVKRVIIAMVSGANSNWHKNGWIKFDQKKVAAETGFDRLPQYRFTKIMVKIHDVYEMRMRVIGSNNPIACYSFPWYTHCDDPSKLIDFGFAVPSGFEAVEEYLTNLSVDEETKD